MILDHLGKRVSDRATAHGSKRTGRLASRHQQVEVVQQQNSISLKIRGIEHAGESVGVDRVDPGVLLQSRAI